MRYGMIVALVLAMVSTAGAEVYWDWTGNTLSLNCDPGDEVVGFVIGSILGNGAFTDGQVDSSFASRNDGYNGVTMGHPFGENAWGYVYGSMDTGQKFSGGVMFSVEYAGSTTTLTTEARMDYPPIVVYVYTMESPYDPSLMGVEHKWVPRSDVDGNTDVNMADFHSFCTHWLESGCASPDWCDRCDVDQSGDVGMTDLAHLFGEWLD